MYFILLFFYQLNGNSKKKTPAIHDPYKFEEIQIKSC